MAARRSLPIHGGVDAGARPVAREQVLAALEAGMAPVAIAETIARALDDLARQHEALGSPGGSPPACARGCSSCCHQRVDVTAPEILALARHVRASRDLEVLREHVEATRGALDGLSGREHHLRRVPCALLAEDGACAVHPARPFACRRGHSVDADACRRAYADPTSTERIPDNPTLAWNTAAIVLGYREGFEHAGTPLDTYELNAALAIALAAPDVEARFLAGEDPFASARTHTAEEIRALLA